jgi:hypothetical protein
MRLSMAMEQRLLLVFKMILIVRCLVILGKVEEVECDYLSPIGDEDKQSDLEKEENESVFKIINEKVGNLYKSEPKETKNIKDKKDKMLEKNKAGKNKNDKDDNSDDDVQEDDENSDKFVEKDNTD